MRSAAYLAAISCLLSATSAAPRGPLNDRTLLDKRQEGSYYAITGASGGVQPRLEIRELQKNAEMWNLYLLAMNDFEAMDQDELTSYYQIAGIHGMPWTSWDGVEGSAGDDKLPFQRGYCPHNQHLFGTWHRPYLVLFEQKLQEIAISLANRFPSAVRAAYQDAASKLRIPYWDWAKAVATTDTVLPSAVTVTTVDVTFPNGTTGTIDNPLFDYNFHPLDNTQINGTGCPTSGGQGGATGGVPRVCQESQMTIRNGDFESNHAGLESKLRNILTSQRTKVYNSLSQYQSFDSFSNDGSCGGFSRVGSLESVHNPIHTSMFPGHMSPPSVAAFDPIFWMHHANVDRQMALFQAVFPDTYVEQCSADTPTFTIQTGDLLDANSALTPFHLNAAGDFWTSASSRYIQDMGYTYPELQGNPSNDSLVAQIKALYSGSSTGTRRLMSREDSKQAENPRVYLAEVTLPLYGLGDGGVYNVAVFLGDVPNNSKDWLGSNSFVGLAASLGGINMKNNQVATATLPLSAAIEEAQGVLTKSEAETVAYLKENLHWRIELGGDEIPLEAVQGLKVNLISTEVELATSDTAFDRWVGGFTDHGEILP